MTSPLAKARWIRRQRRPCGRLSAFTLIELLVVVAILALLIAILLPSLERARQQGRRTLCLSNMHQLSIGLFTYQGEHRGCVPQWPTYSEQVTDGIALWVQGDSRTGHPTRLGMLYPKYVGRNENIFYCPDAKDNRLLNKGDGDATALYPWSNFGTNKGWAYGSYEYRARYYFGAGATSAVWVDVNANRDSPHSSIAADGFSGSWDSYGPLPAHTPIQKTPKMLYYNVAYLDGSANPVKDYPAKGRVSPFAIEFKTRAPGPVQQQPKYRTFDPIYTPLTPYNNPPLPPKRGTPAQRTARDQMLNATAHIDRAWTFFDLK
jgi:prepilin-type N-terminal cleavage/methylation domain-containing protein